MTLGISIERVIEEIYAMSALRNYMMVKDGDVVDCPAVLHEDHAEALAKVVRQAIGFVAMRLTPWVVASDFAEDGGDIVTMVLDGEAGGDYGSVIGEEVRVGVVAMALHLCLLGSDDDAADEYLEKAKDACRAVGVLMTELVPEEGIVGQWIA